MPGDDSDNILKSLGMDEGEIESLRASGTIA
jgi:hypothetical protein